jgi:hypothetical protein
MNKLRFLKMFKLKTMKKLRLLSIVVLLGIVFTQISAQIQDPGKAIPADPNIKIGKLENGLTYYIKVN